MRAPRLPLLVMLALLGMALFVGARDDGAATPAARVDRLAGKVRCPTCAGISAAESDASSSVAVREEIARRVAAGETDDQILRFLVDSYGTDLLLEPPASGVGALVWALPVVAVVLAGAALVVVFRRWRARGFGGPVSDADRARVARALHE